MSGKLIKVCLAGMLLLFAACSAGSDSRLYGKWVLSGPIIGMSPSSYWFKNNRSVIAPWEEEKSHLQSKGRYEFIDKSHIKIVMQDGHYGGITFFFEILKIDDKELVLRGSIQDIRMKRAG